MEILQANDFARDLEYSAQGPRDKVFFCERAVEGASQMGPDR